MIKPSKKLRNFKSMIIKTIQPKKDYLEKSSTNKVK